MRHALLFFLFSLSPFLADAQPFAIGNANRTYYDQVRNRDVACEIHYPAVADGNEEPIATGIFPVIVIGHGFVMTVDAYTYLWTHLVPLGYIAVLPTTEGGFAPDHEAFGKDIAFLAEHMSAENLDTASLFFGHVAPERALAGHSMGGGAAVLGAASNSAIQACMVLAPAETSPSAIAAAAQVTAPTLIFGAGEDCVTPIATNQQPLYDGLNLTCKALVNVIGGGHCYFGDENLLCTFGELTCGPDLTITRAEQQDIVKDVGTLWLDRWLRNDLAALSTFIDSLGASARFTSQSACLSTGIASLEQEPCSLVHEAGSDRITLSCEATTRITGLFDIFGRALPTSISEDARSLRLGAQPSGLILVGVIDGLSRQRFLPFVVAR